MIKKIIYKVQNLQKFPVEICDVVDILIENGIQDNIIIDFFDKPVEELRGVCYQYTVSPGVYVPPDFVSLIAYNKNLSLNWQRITCCKELVHVCERQFERTNSLELVEGLLEKLVRSRSSEDFGLSDYMATKDRLGVYLALGILFPISARKQAEKAISDGTASVSLVAEWACIPEPLIKIALLPEWPEIFNSLTD